MRYYTAQEEWLYPTESGREPIAMTYDISEDKELDQTADALNMALKKCEDERKNFFESTKCDPTFASAYQHDNGEIGCIITCKDGLSEWYYAVRLIPVDSLEAAPIRYMPNKDEKKKNTKKYSVDVHWDVARSYEIEAESREDAEKKMWDIINKGNVCVWTDGFEATDDIEVESHGEENEDTGEIEFD